MSTAVAAVAEVRVIPLDGGLLVLVAPEPGNGSPGHGCLTCVGAGALQELAVESDAVADLEGRFHWHFSL